MNYDNYKTLASKILDASNIRNKDLMLVSIYTNEDSSKEKWDSFNNEIDFENEPYDFNCTLSGLGAKYSWKMYAKI